MRGEPTLVLQGSGKTMHSLRPAPTDGHLNRCWITDNYPLEQLYLEYFFVSTLPTTERIMETE